jgi:type IV secretory pathway VirJ component
VALLLLAAPALLLRYLPMTDVPQQWAVVSILHGLSDPRMGFAAYYESAWSRTPCLLPYAVAMGLMQAVGLDATMRLLELLSLVSYPLGVLALLRAQGKPAWLALLSLPLVYNRAFFWGALLFSLSLGPALLACAQLVRPRRGWREEALAAATCLVVVTTSLYGAAMVLGFAALAFALGERARLRERRLPLVVLLVGAAAWLWLGEASFSTGAWYFEPLGQRLGAFDDEILGGWRGPWEDALLLAFGAVWLALSASRLPVTRERWRSLAPAERVLLASAGLCALLYFVLPTHSPYAKAVHFRFALLAALWLPAAAGAEALERRPRLARGMLLGLAAASLALAWVQLPRFDREARAFDAVLAALPERPKALMLGFERDGRLLRTDPYLHFLAYAQARRGGVSATSFVGEFWHYPLRERADSPRPATPPDLVWHPERFDAQGFGAWYEWVIVRTRRPERDAPLSPDGYALVLDATPWRLYRRLSPAAPPQAMQAGRLGEVSLFRPAADPRGFVFLFSDADGFTPDLARAAAALAARGTAVVGVDLRSYRRGLAASDDGCHYVIAEIEALSQRLQRELGFDRYRSPLLAGVGEGATLACAGLAQSPAATVAGAVCVDPSVALRTRVPLCAGAASTPVATGGFAYGAVAEPPGILRRETTAAGEDRSARLVAAVDALLEGVGEAPRALSGLPLVEVPAAPGGELLAVIYSGDGGWRDLDKTIAEILARRGVPVVGVDSLRYFWRAKSPDEVARDLASILAAYRARWGARKVLLIGYSFGAGILPFAVNRLAAAEREAIVQLSLLGLEPTAPFEFHVSGWLGGESKDARPVLPELVRIDPRLVQCVYGEEEENTLCRAPELAGCERIRTSGGHHFDGDYQGLARKILAGAERRIGARR